MNRNMLRTLLGYAGTLIAKYTPLKWRGDGLDDIYNRIDIDDRLSTSGQPTEAQFASIADAGFETVINLLPQERENALKDEEHIVRDLGMDYVYIPVDFRAPADEDFRAFAAAMQANMARKTWIHCAANARVTAFMTKYRCDVLGENCEAARADMAQIWEPFGIWVEFIEREIALDESGA